MWNRITELGTPDVGYAVVLMSGVFCGLKVASKAWDCCECKSSTHRGHKNGDCCLDTDKEWEDGTSGSV